MPGRDVETGAFVRRAWSTRAAREDVAPDMSVIPPVHNEAPSLPMLWPAAAAAAAGWSAEVLFVDDGSCACGSSVR